MLKIEDLHVYYGAIHAVKGISLSIPKGSIVTLIGANGNQTDPPPGKVEHLQRLRKLDQATDVFGNHLLGAQREINRKILRCQQAGIFEKIARTQPGNPRRHIENALRQLAVHQIGLVALRHSNDQVGIIRTGITQG